MFHINSPFSLILFFRAQKQNPTTLSGSATLAATMLSRAIIRSCGNSRRRGAGTRICCALAQNAILLAPLFIFRNYSALLMYRRNVCAGTATGKRQSCPTHYIIIIYFAVKSTVISSLRNIRPWSPLRYSPCRRFSFGVRRLPPSF